jgi:hypothetical protein
MVAEDGSMLCIEPITGREPALQEYYRFSRREIAR